MTLEDYLRSIDPEYGSQEHQRAFLARMARAEAANPCTRDHDEDKPPTHRTACYPSRRGRMLEVPVPKAQPGAAGAPAAPAAPAAPVAPVAANKNTTTSETTNKPPNPRVA